MVWDRNLECLKGGYILYLYKRTFLEGSVTLFYLTLATPDAFHRNFGYDTFRYNNHILPELRQSFVTHG